MIQKQVLKAFLFIYQSSHHSFQIQVTDLKTTSLELPHGTWTCDLNSFFHELKDVYGLTLNQPSKRKSNYQWNF